MPHTTSDGPAIYYKTSGDPAGAPVVLISGAGAQLIWWREAFVERLVAKGMFVIRLDNRDVGRSQRFGGPADIAAVYSVDDMADDVFRVLDALGLPAAHLVGQSLGGAIAQAMAIARPERVLSFVLFYTVPAFDARWLTEELQDKVLRAAPPPPAPPSRGEAIDLLVEREQFTRSTDYPFDDAWLLEVATRSVERGFCPAGMLRQAAAAGSFGDRSEALRALNQPAAVVHGRVDRLLKVDAGFELGRLLPQAELHIYPGMGHEIVELLWPEFVTIIARTVGRACR